MQNLWSKPILNFNHIYARFFITFCRLKILTALISSDKNIKKNPENETGQQLHIRPIKGTHFLLSHHWNMYSLYSLETAQRGDCNN